MVANYSLNEIHPYTLYIYFNRGFISIVDRGHFKRIKHFNEYLFVYGSLKKTYWNNILLIDSKFISEDITCDTYSMYDLGMYPCIIKDPLGWPVKGELYEVDSFVFGHLDLLEGYPNHYKREKVRLSSGIEAWIYFMEEKRSYGKIEAFNGILEWDKRG